MKALATYFLITYFTVLVILCLKGLYLGFQFVRLIQERHPEKAREYGLPHVPWSDVFKLFDGIYKQDDFEDPEVSCLKIKSRKTRWVTLAVAILGFFVLCLITITSNFYADKPPLLYFDLKSCVLIVIGLFFLLLAKDITSIVLKHCSDSKLTRGKFRNLLYIWPTRFMGIICLAFAFFIAGSGPGRAITKHDENRLVLLTEGQIVEGEVTKSFYQYLASEGWKIVYRFNAEEPKTGKEKTYSGSAQGPWQYYSRLFPGEPVTVIYHPLNPAINCEIKYFLNYPSFRNTFKAAGKLHLLDKFRNEYPIEDYSFKEWFRLQRVK